MAKSKKRAKKAVATKVVDKKDKLTWKYWIIGALVVAAIGGLMFLVSWLAAQGSIVTFTVDGNTLVRDYDGAMFLKAPETIAVRYTVGNKYGKTEDSKIYKVGFYDSYGNLQTMDVENYLTDGEGNLYYGSYAVIPELKGFSADAVYVCTEEFDGLTTALTSLTNTHTPDATDLVNEYLNKNRYFGEGNPQHTYTLYLTSSVYTHLYYVMYLVQCDNGDFYIYTKEDTSSFQVSSSWFDSLIPGSEDTTTDTTAEEAPTTKAPEEAE